MSFVPSQYDSFALTYGIVTLIGGLIGYFKANSLISLASSSVFGGIIFYAATQLPPAKASKVMLGVGAVLGMFFGIRYGKSHKFMPAGLMTILSGFAVVKYAKELGLF